MALNWNDYGKALYVFYEILLLQIDVGDRCNLKSKCSFWTIYYYLMGQSFQNYWQ